MNTTKILKRDLDFEIQELLNELILIQGDSEKLTDKLLNIDTSMMAEDEKRVIEDLKEMYLSSGKLLSERIEIIEDYIRLSPEEGNFNEAFTYESGDIKKHEVTGDSNYSITYEYGKEGTANAGDIVSSVKSYLRDNGDLVSIKKTYSYLSGDITSIQTETTVTPKENDLANEV